MIERLEQQQSKPCPPNISEICNLIQSCLCKLRKSSEEATFPISTPSLRLQCVRSCSAVEATSCHARFEIIHAVEIQSAQTHRMIMSRLGVGSRIYHENYEKSCVCIAGSFNHASRNRHHRYDTDRASSLRFTATSLTHNE